MQHFNTSCLFGGQFLGLVTILGPAAHLLTNPTWIGLGVFVLMPPTPPHPDLPRPAPEVLVVLLEVDFLPEAPRPGPTAVVVSGSAVIPLNGHVANAAMPFVACSSAS